MFDVKIDEQKCVVCKLCELACSYHHRKVFDPEISSIEINRTGKAMEVTGIVYSDKGEGSHLACDRCSGEPAPLCSKYCEWNAVIIVQSSGGVAS
jgi:Fe-S-cluster-containing hydrogenase component 2